MTQKKNENPFLNLVFSLVMPSLILTKLSSPDRLGPVASLLLALSFPIGYSIFDFSKRRELSFITALGFISTLLTGVFALYELPAQWIAVKEAAVPCIIGVAILVSMRTPAPLVKRILFNENVINVALVEEKLATLEHRTQFEQLLREASYLLALSFLFSSLLNFLLAKILLVSLPGTPEFNAELGKMNAMSWPVIALPSTLILVFALWRLIKGIKSLTGLDMEQVLKSHDK